MVRPVWCNEHTDNVQQVAVSAVATAVTLISRKSLPNPTAETPQLFWWLGGSLGFFVANSFAAVAAALPTAATAGNDTDDEVSGRTNTSTSNSAGVYEDEDDSIPARWSRRGRVGADGEDDVALLGGDLGAGGEDDPRPIAVRVAAAQEAGNASSSHQNS
jgi:hypothetical protein